MKTFSIGQRVRHDFSRTLGNIRIIDSNRKYPYFVIWDDEPERSDWYKADVLERVEE